MTDSDNDTGVLQALSERMLTYRLPRAQQLKRRVNSGELLSDYDIQFLERVFREAQQLGGLVDRHPEWQEVATKMVALYHDITEQGLANEKARRRGEP